jgi:hypothetical protein
MMAALSRLGKCLAEKPIVDGDGNPGSNPHCLARIYINQQKRTAIALLSDKVGQKMKP